MTPDQFKSLRLELGLSQAKLASLLGVLPRQVKRWEKGKAGISGPVILAMRYIKLKKGRINASSSAHNHHRTRMCPYTVRRLT